MDGALPLARFAARLRNRPFGVDVELAAVVGLVTVLPPVLVGVYEGAQVLVGLLLVAPLAWRRRAPVPAAVAVTMAGLLGLVVSDEILLADVAALMMVYALAAYAPRWAGPAGLALGLFGTGLFVLRHFWFDLGGSGVP